MMLAQIDVISVDPSTRGIVFLIVSVLLPVLVGIVTKRFASGGLKATMLLFLAGLSGFLNEFIATSDAGEVFNWNQALLNWVVSFGVAVLIHFGLWKPTGIADGVQVATRNIGFGPRENKHAAERDGM